MSKLIAIPVTLKEANAFVKEYHRHNKPVVGHKFCVGVSDGEKLVGVAIAGRPVARLLDGGFTIEVARVCVSPDAPLGACSFLYARCWQAAKALGYTRIVTYTLQSESGASLRGAGWKIVAELDSHKGWSNKTRQRDWQPIYGQTKLRWEMEI